jgi:hypothetical protein
MARRFAQLSERFQQWERRVGARLSGWSVRRRWLVLVLLPTLLICGCGTVVGIPAAWVLRTTLAAIGWLRSPGKISMVTNAQ